MIIYNPNPKLPFMKREYTALKTAINNSDKKEILKLINKGLNINAFEIHESRSEVGERRYNLSAKVREQNEMYNEYLKSMGEEPIALASDDSDFTDEDNTVELVMTPLCYAVLQENFEIAKFLLDMKADINIKSREQQQTILMIANDEYLKSEEIYQLLISRGVDVNAVDQYGENILHSSLMCSNYKIVKLFIEAGVDVNSRDKEGLTVLMKAANGCDYRIIKHLVKAGADVNARDKNEETALIMASKEYEFQRIKALIEGGSDVNAMCKQGKTPLEYAFEQRRNLTIIKLILKHGGVVRQGIGNLYNTAKIEGNVDVVENIDNARKYIDESTYKKKLKHKIDDVHPSRMIKQIMAF